MFTRRGALVGAPPIVNQPRTTELDRPSSIWYTCSYKAGNNNKEHTMNTTTTTAIEAADITAQPPVSYLVRINESESLNYLIEGPARVETQYGYKVVTFTVWMGGVMVELKVPDDTKVVIATEADPTA